MSVEEDGTVRAWYLGCTADEVGDRAILVGDRGRLAIAARLLDDVAWINEDRGLVALTGRRGDVRITAVAFGMGAPIATVVLHELAQLGVATFLRLGTMMSLPPTRLGDLVLAASALRHEGTSATYLPPDVPATSDAALDAAVLEALADSTRTLHHGPAATFDGFYTQMAGDPARGYPVDVLRDALIAQGVVGTDMETSALMVAARALGVRCASLCAATVDGVTLARLGPVEREPLETELMSAGIAALAAFDPSQHPAPEPIARITHAGGSS